MWTLKSSVMLGATALALSSVGACYAELTPDADYVETSPPAVDVSAYPRYYYRGEPVYWVNDRWYARDGGRWVYYRSEPEPLVRQRTHVEHAPPAPDREEQRFVARPRTEAPPAVRVQ